MKELIKELQMVAVRCDLDDNYDLNDAAEDVREIANRLDKLVTNCNQLKMRESLEWFWSKRSMLDFCHTNLSAKTWRDWDKVYYFLREFADKVQAALSAPPRNCDLYATEEDAWQAFSSVRQGVDSSTEEYEPWLFAEAKGEMK